MVVLIAIVGVAVVGLLLLGLGGWFVYQKAKEAGFDYDLLKENPGVAVAKMVAAVNPNLELVSVDEAAGKVTLLDKESGKTVTLNLEDVVKGKISFETEEGETSSLEITGGGDEGAVRVQTSEGTVEYGVTAGKLPEWIPVYPGSTVQMGMSSQSSEERNGQAVITTNDSAKELVEYYSRAFEKAGLEVNTIHPAGAAGESVIINAEEANGSRQAMVMVGKREQDTTASVSFSEKK